MTDQPEQPAVLQQISDDWRNRDKSEQTEQARLVSDEGDPNTRSEEPEPTPAPAPKAAPSVSRVKSKAAGEPA